MTDTLKQSTDSALIATGRVEGVKVFDLRGEKLGVIKDVYVNKRSGQAEFVALAFGGALGVGESHHPLPWAALSFDKELDGFIVALEKSVLAASPGFAEGELSGEAWADKARIYYNQLSGPAGKEGRHVTDGAAAPIADAPHSRPTEAPAQGEKVDHLAEKLDKAESRQEALLDEAIEESFPASDPVSAKHIT